MDGGIPMLNCLLQHTLRTLCSRSDSSKWVYAVYWRILPRNYPPPKWDYGGSPLDRVKGNKRNWILVWEDGFCDFYDCERAKGRFGTDVFFKMSHEVYNYGEGLVGKVASENSHKWVFKETSNETDSTFISPWNMSNEPQPKAWEFQFSSGIQTIALISVREGIIQLGSFDKIMEDLNLVITIQRKFSYLQNIPGIFTIQRPYLPIKQSYILKPDTPMLENQETSGTKRSYRHNMGDVSPMKSINLGWNSPQHGITGPPIWSIPPLLPTMSYNFGTIVPSVLPSYNGVIEAHDTALINSILSSKTRQRQKFDAKPESSCQTHVSQEEKPMV